MSEQVNPQWKYGLGWARYMAGDAILCEVTVQNNGRWYFDKYGIYYETVEKAQEAAEGYARAKLLPNMHKIWAQPEVKP